MKIQISKIKSSVTSVAAAAGRRFKTIIKYISKKIDSLTAVTALVFIWAGVRQYNSAAALIAVGAILITDLWLDRFLKRRSR